MPVTVPVDYRAAHSAVARAVNPGAYVQFRGYASLERAEAALMSLEVPYYRVETDGMPGPALEMRRMGALRILWPVESGNRQFSIWCRHSGHTPLPRVRIARAPSLGLSSDVEAQAQATSDWHQLTLSLLVTGTGVLEVYLEHRAPDEGAWVRWDSAGAG